MENLIEQVMEFVKTNAVWAPFIIMALTFLESIAFFSLFIPAWGMIVAFGPLVGSAGLSPWPILVGAATGAAMGDWVSYLIGFHFKDRIGTWWPFRNNPAWIPRAHDFFGRWGWAAIFIGRFSGPLRASVPLVAGMIAMPFLQFQIANWLSAFIWVAALLVPGIYAGPEMVGWFGKLLGWLGG